MQIFICIPVHNRSDFTIRCIDSLRAQTLHCFSVLVCDDGSSDGTAEHLAFHYPEVKLLKGNGNLWWAGATNLCIEHALKDSQDASDYILTLNNDLEVRENYLSTLIQSARRHCGAIITSTVCDVYSRKPVNYGARHNWLTTKDRPIDPVRDSLPGDRSVAEVTHASGRGTLFPVGVFKKIGKFDAKHLPHYGADYDLTHRARRAGYSILVSFDACVYSHLSETGLTEFRRDFSVKEFKKYLSDTKSPANLKSRWWFALKNVPLLFFFYYFFLDVSFVIGSYFRNHPDQTA